MKLSITTQLLFCTLVCLIAHIVSAIDDKTYVNEWAVRVAGGERIAREVAHDNGFEFVKKIGSLKDMYKLRHAEYRRNKRSADDFTENLNNDLRVQWVAQQHLNEHQKRDYKPLPDNILRALANPKNRDLLRAVYNDENLLRSLSEVPTDVLPPDATGDDDKPLVFDDPLFPKQWYLFNQGVNGAIRGIDMNTMPAWKLGITGYGVVVSIIDDGVDPTHPDLAPNFDMNASHDFQNKTDDPNPHPDDSKEKGSENDHGTRCAGEVAAAANNSVCGVGVAYDANIGGMRVLDGPVTDAMEAEALNFNNQHIDVYSCCWGPPDDGNNFRKPHPLTAEALVTGVKEGRGGKGSIFVWASGNGGDKDDCSADGYVSNIRSISIGAINDKGLSSYFMESCPSTMAVVVSGGPHKMGGYTKGQTLNLVVTTDLHHKCTDHFVGTSSSAPLASGVMALILQANPELTWRDVQHIIAEGAMLPNVQQDGWHINGAGFHVNPMFGFGVLDAGKMVKLALTWDHVPEQQQCDVEKVIYKKKVPMGESRNVTMEVNKCQDITKLEHTIAYISFKSPRRGDVGLRLISPMGTPSQILSTRPKDHTDEGLEDWPFMTVHNWGEDPTGTWILEVTNNMPDKTTMTDFLASEKPQKGNPDHEDGDHLELVPRLTEAIELVDWGFTFYGTSDHEHKGKQNEKEYVEDNPAINPELAGPASQETVKDIWNDEQGDDEEIVIDPNDISPHADLPPNLENNFDDGQINTGAFNGKLADDEMYQKGDGDKKKMLMYLMLLEIKEIDRKLQQRGLQDEYARAMEAIAEYGKKNDEELARRYNYNVDEIKRYKAEYGKQNDEELAKQNNYNADETRHYNTDETKRYNADETRRRMEEGLNLDNLNREDILLLLREIQEELKK